MIIMASGIARGRVRMTTTMESRNMATILLKKGWQRHKALVYCVKEMILDNHAVGNWHLSLQGIRWPVSRGHIADSSLQLIEVTCFFLKLTADQVLVFPLDRGLMSG